MQALSERKESVTTPNIDGPSAASQAGIVGAQAASAQIPVDPQLEEIWKSTQSDSTTDKRSGLQRPSGKENHVLVASASMAHPRVSHFSLVFYPTAKATCRAGPRRTIWRWTYAALIPTSRC